MSMQNQIPQNWQKVKLGNIGFEVRDLYEPTKNEALPYIGLEHIEQQSLRLLDTGLSSETQSTKKKFLKDDILFGTLRPYFRKVVIPKFNGVCSTDITVLRAKPNYDQKYLFYFIANKHFINYATSSSNGTKMPRANWKTISKSEWYYPSLPIQQKIASILTAFDDKIEVNNKIAKNLEEMAQALFKEWFVKFRFPGYKKTEFVDSELGKIPGGWDAKFPDIAYFQEGPGIRNWQYRESGIPFINIRCFKGGEIDLSDASYLDSQEVEKTYNHFLLDEGDFIISSSGTLGRIAKVRKYHLPLMLNTSVIRIRPQKGFSGYCFLKYFLRSPYFQNQINAFATGSAQPNYGPSHLKELTAIKPADEIIKMFGSIVFPMEKKLDEIAFENKNLAAFRDLLLPKLMRGEIKV